jgi:MFS family permease
MLGMFMIFPVFALYVTELEGATPLLMGVAMGVYGLSQGILQIPFGMMSDHFGRKPVILAGLLLFVLGSIVAGLSDSIYGVIAGRALQGCGAIAAAVMALMADLTREEQRTKAMATVGMSIGVSFALALVLGPVMNSWIGLSGIFWFTAVMAVTGMAILWFVVPDPVTHRLHRDAEPVPAQFARVLSDGQLLRLDAGIFLLHMILTSSFMVLPLVLKDVVGLAAERHWWVYLPVLLLSVLTMVPFIIQAERHRKMKKVFLLAVAMLGLSQLGMVWLHTSMWGAVSMLYVFFTAFNFLEASLPSLVSKIAPVESKGTAMGFYSSSQFIGVSLGGVISGWVLGHHGYTGIFILCAILALIWFVLASSMKSPRYLVSYLLNIGKLSSEQSRQLVMELTSIQGVAEAVVIAEDEVAYLKVDRKALDEEKLLSYSNSDKN